MLAVGGPLVPGADGEFVGEFLIAPRRLLLDRDCVRMGPAVFRVPELVSGFVFVRGNIVEAVASAGLSGFGFELVRSVAQGWTGWPRPGVIYLVETRSIIGKYSLTG